MRFASSIAAIVSLATAISFAACSSSSSDEPPPPNDGGPDGAIEASDIDAGPDGARPPPGPADAKSGTRIKALYHDTDDGYSVFSTLHDGMLDVDCDVVIAEDGMPRCLPVGVAQVAPSLFTAGCTTAVAQLSKDACAPTYASDQIDTPGNPCGQKRVRYAIGAKVTAIFTKDSGGTCIAATPPPDQVYYELGAKVDPASLVLFHDEHADLTPALARRMFVGADGSRIPTAELIDLARTAPCMLRGAADDKMRCLPESRMETSFFSDVGCGTAVANLSSCLVPTMVYDDTASLSFEFLPECSVGSSRAHVRAVGAKRATKDYYSGSPASCGGPFTGTEDLYDLGAELPASTFPEVIAEKRGGSRLMGGVFTSNGTVVESDTSVTDTKLGSTCFIQTAGDGKLRCIPSGAFFAGAFSDVECKLPYAYDTSGCTPITYATKSDLVGCESRTHAFTVGPKADIATTQVYSSLGGGCTGPTSPGSGKALYPLAAELDPATLVEVHLVAH